MINVNLSYHNLCASHVALACF